LAAPITTEEQVAYVLVQLRKILELRRYPKDQYIPVRFICDWAVHAEIDRNGWGRDSLIFLDEIIVQHKTWKELTAAEQNKFQSIPGLEALREGLMHFLKEEGIASDPGYRRSRDLRRWGVPYPLINRGEHQRVAVILFACVPLAMVVMRLTEECCDSGSPDLLSPKASSESVLGSTQETTAGPWTFQPLMQSQRMKKISPKAVMKVKSRLTFGRTYGPTPAIIQPNPATNKAIPNIHGM
jgi:hypothetical protein